MMMILMMLLMLSAMMMIPRSVQQMYLHKEIYDCRCAPDLSRGDSVLLPTIKFSFGLADI
jgi:hypothetical protein